VSPRRVVVATTLFAFVAGGAGAALADGPIKRHPRNEICIVLAQNDDGSVTKDFCINWPGPQPQ